MYVHAFYGTALPVVFPIIPLCLTIMQARVRPFSRAFSVPRRKCPFSSSPSIYNPFFILEAVASQRRRRWFDDSEKSNRTPRCGGYLRGLYHHYHYYWTAVSFLRARRSSLRCTCVCVCCKGRYESCPRRSILIYTRGFGRSRARLEVIDDRLV